jgi:cytochrome c peroxidase
VLVTDREHVAMSKRLTYLLLGSSGLALAGALSLLLLRFLPKTEPPAEPVPEAAARESTDEPIRPVPEPAGLDDRKVALGNQLFHDPVLSHDGTVACAKCHDLGQGGTDRLPHPVGGGGRAGLVNAPTVFNSSLNFRQFWDGRAATLEDQIDGPVNSPLELGSGWEEILGKLRQDPDYRARFAGLYPDGVQAGNVKDAIATFERSLLTPSSRFDRFLRGDRTALTRDEQEGYERFKAYGCVACHQGVGMGGNMYALFGVMDDYFAGRDDLTEADLGRFKVTGRDRDRHLFKVPGLRNVALTAPYFHDGSGKNLHMAVGIMARYQLGRRLSATEADQIVKFLETLTGEYKGVPL